MASDGIVVVHDPFDGDFRQAFQVGPWAGMDEFLLVGREERFRNGIVVTDPGLSE